MGQTRAPPGRLPQCDGNLLEHESGLPLRRSAHSTLLSGLLGVGQPCAEPFSQVGTIVSRALVARGGASQIPMQSDQKVSLDAA